MNCKNCGEAIHGNYCIHCGQKSTVGKINYSTLSNELSETIFQVNRGFFFTIKELFLRPGESIREYLAGKRQNHYKPIAFLLILSALYFLITKANGDQTLFNEILSGIYSGISDSNVDDISNIDNSELTNSIPSALTWIANNYPYVTLILLPIFSFCSFLCFKKFKINYLEHVVMNSYITGQQALLYSLHALVNGVFNNSWFEASVIIVGIFYCIWVYLGFFKGANKFWLFVRIVFTYLLNLILSSCLFFLILAIFDNGLK